MLDAWHKPIRGLWRRGSRFYARLRVANATGHRIDRRVPLKATTAAKAQVELERLKEQRDDRALVVASSTPSFGTYVRDYLTAAKQLKRHRTVKTEEIHLNHWAGWFGDQRLNRITKASILAFRTRKLQGGWTGRTANLSLTVLRNLLNRAIDEELLVTSPAAGIKPVRWVPKRRPLVTQEEIEAICVRALEACRNGQLLADYLRLMALCGSRRTESLRLKWTDVDWVREQLTIGSDGETKNHESRVVDFNPKLRAHLHEMHSRRDPQCEFLFPAPRESPNASSATTSLVSSLETARKAAGLSHFGFHDCRHHFISYAVMSGIDYMTIARWVGHKDGGVLIGRVYGHLSNEHAQRQARKLTFNTEGSQH